MNVWLLGKLVQLALKILALVLTFHRAKNMQSNWAEAFHQRLEILASRVRHDSAGQRDGLRTPDQFQRDPPDKPAANCRTRRD